MAQSDETFDLPSIPILLQKEIIKKMKLKSVISLQKTSKYYFHLVDVCHSMILDKYHRVRNYKSFFEKYYVFRGKKSEREFLTIQLGEQLRLTRKYENTQEQREMNNEFMMITDIIDVWTHIFEE